MTYIEGYLKFVTLHFHRARVDYFMGRYSTVLSHRNSEYQMASIDGRSGCVTSICGHRKRKSTARAQHHVMYHRIGARGADESKDHVFRSSEICWCIHEVFHASNGRLLEQHKVDFLFLMYSENDRFWIISNWRNLWLRAYD